MIAVPQEIQELFKQDSISKNFRVHFPNGEFRDLVNKDFISESVIFTESISSGNAVKFGTFEKSSIEFKTYFAENIKMKLIFCGIEIDISELSEDFIAEYGHTSQDVSYPYYFIPYGYFVVTNSSFDDSGVQSITAYQTGVTPDELTFPELEFIKMYEPFSVAYWSDSVFSESHKTSYLLSKEKFFAETFNSCAYLKNRTPIEEYTEQSSLLNTDLNCRTLKVLQVPTDTFRWVMPQFIPGSSVRAYHSGLSHDVTIHVKGIQLHFDTDKIYKYDKNSLGVEISGSRYEASNDANLPAKNHIYELTWQNDISQTISKSQIEECVPGLYDVLGKELIDELIKPCMKFEYTAPCKYSCQPKNTYTDYTIVYRGSDFCVTPLRVNEPDPLPNGNYGNDIYAYLRGYYYHVSKSNPSIGGWTSTRLFEAVSRGQSYPEDDRYRYTDIKSGYSIPIVSKFSDAQYELFQYRNTIFIGMTQSQNFRNFNVPVSNGKYNLVINPYMHIVDETEGVDITPKSLSVKPHISISIPTELVIFYGTDVGKGQGTGSFDLCSSEPHEDNFSVYTIPLNSWQNPILKKFEVDDETDADNITVPINYAFAEFSNTLDTEYYENTDPKDNKVYIGLPYYGDASGYLNSQHCIRCELSQLNLIADKKSNYFLDIVESQGLLVSTYRTKYYDNYKLISLNPFSEDAVYPGDDVYPNDTLFPSGLTPFNIPRSLWYKLSVDTLEKIVYDKVCCTIPIDGEMQYFESPILNNLDSNYLTETYVHYDLSNNLYLKSGLLQADTIQSILDDIAETLREIYYNTALMTVKGLPYLEPGDKLQVITKDSSITTYILRRRLRGIQSLIDEIETR